jgi:cytochrome c556
MLRTFVFAGTLLVGIGAVMAQDAAKDTQAMMKANGKNAGALTAMVKGEKPYDQAAVDAAFVQFTETAKKFPTLFPASMKGMKLNGDYDASPKVWDDKAGFDEHAASFAKTVDEVKGKVKDLETLKVNLPLVGKQCGGCHETYRIKHS